MKKINNILFISIDNLRFDCVGFQPFQQELKDHGALEHLYTPTLDALAERSRCFTQCVSTNTYTTASHASILTGLYPPRHGVRAFFETKLSPEAASIAEILKSSGYRTILYTDVPDLFVPLDLHRGFNQILTCNDAGLFDLLEGLHHDKVLLFVHFYDVHEPYMLRGDRLNESGNEDWLKEMLELTGHQGIPDSFTGTQDGIELWNRLLEGPLGERPIDILLPLYVKGVTKFDRGRFAGFMDDLSRIGFLDSALTAIFSDHGEGRCSRENKTKLGHAGELFDNVIRVPLMIACPGLEPGVDDRLISTVDILPTVLSMLQVQGPPRADGFDVFAAERRMCYAENWTMSEATGLYTDGGRIAADFRGSAENVLSQMAVRTPEAKYVFWSRPDIEEMRGPDFDNISEEEFVRTLYRRILGRPADPAGLSFHVDTLERGLLTRSGLIETFLDSAENKSRYDAHYDLERDPREDTPLPGAGPDSQSCREFIRNLNSQAVAAEKIFRENGQRPAGAKTAAPGVQFTTDEEQQVRSRLSDLGYF